MADSYDLEGYHCLIIAILMGVNAKEARILYEYGLNNPVSQKIVKKKHPKIRRVGNDYRVSIIEHLVNNGIVKHQLCIRKKQAEICPSIHLNKQNADFEQAGGFIKKWQKVIRPRLTEEDYRLAKVSERLRGEEFKELRKKDAKIWHGHLAGMPLADVMEADLMEAALCVEETEAIEEDSLDYEPMADLQPVDMMR